MERFLLPQQIEEIAGAEMVHLYDQSTFTKQPEIVD